MKICVIIPMYGHHDLTQRCIDLTRENAGVDCDILVVDDGSPNKLTLNNCTSVLTLPTNTGFTNATNQGILWCGDRYDYIHLLNNDTEPKKDFIKLLLDLMESSSQVGIAASARILNTSNEHNIELHGADLIRGYQLMTNGNIPNEVIYTYWVPLCSALIRHEMIREIGLLDKRMRTWCSDNDYCIRANFNGWNVALVIKSQVLHIHQATTGETTSEERGKGVIADQKVLIEKMAGVQYAELMTKLPLDCEGGTWGRLTFEVYTK